MDLFKDLKGLGLTNLSGLNIYDEDKKEEKKENHVKKDIQEADLLFDKTYKCPVCDNEFKEKAVRTGKSKLLDSDIDLRPKYQDIDPLKYDVILCHRCGYAALTRYFNEIMFSQTKLIKEQISPSFNYKSPTGDTYTYDDSLIRHKLALYNSIIKKGKISERAYICLKIAWLNRAKKENLLAHGEKNEVEIKKCEAEELSFLENAYKGFAEAVSTESFPICGMDETTIEYLLAALSIETKNYDMASKLISKILVSKNANPRIKNKASDLKDVLKEAMEHK